MASFYHSAVLKIILVHLLIKKYVMLLIFWTIFCASQIDCTTESKKCTEHSIHAFPTLKLFKDGREVGLGFDFVKQG